MFSRKQIEKAADLAEQRRQAVRPDATPGPAPADPIPDELWTSLLTDSRAAGKPRAAIQHCRLADIGQHVLRVECQRCVRIVEIQTADAIRLFGQQALWKDVGQRLLDQTCTNRTGRHEEDGCWPDWNR
ncbi:hypothetical protein [Bradyrhizobium sp. AUGA SZCCT0160]|uniref:hypothetical protein n=1 Tax=Bradyrhizobium sp. AUGA SZCCT0160 TaxID=2807662 RepID=UPI002012FB3A|nr:hypothetical protein [Bradyrhizobium sp. AUGA SZCCT0160]